MPLFFKRLNEWERGFMWMLIESILALAGLLGYFFLLFWLTETYHPALFFMTLVGTAFGFCAGCIVMLRACKHPLFQDLARKL